MNRQPSHSRRNLAILMIGLIVWTAVLATGAFFFGYRQDVRKPIIVFGAMLLFLGVWVTLLVFRSARHAKGAVSQGNSKVSRVSSSVEEVNEYSGESAHTQQSHSRKAEDG